jgi:hypothetical protein
MPELTAVLIDIDGVLISAPSAALMISDDIQFDVLAAQLDADGGAGPFSPGRL